MKWEVKGVQVVVDKKMDKARKSSALSNTKLPPSLKRAKR